MILQLFLFYFVTFPKNDVHDIHVSRCEIQYNEESKSFEIAVQIYLDDLQTILSKHGSENLYLCTEKEKKDAHIPLMNYLAKKLVVTADGRKLEGNFIGKESSEDLLAVWCYIEMPCTIGFKELKVKYDVLMDLYDDQRNIVNLKAKGKKGYMLFNNNHLEEILTF